MQMWNNGASRKQIQDQIQDQTSPLNNTSPLFSNKNRFFFLGLWSTIWLFRFSSNLICLMWLIALESQSEWKQTVHSLQPAQTIATVNNIIFFHFFLLCSLSRVLTKWYRIKNIQWRLHLTNRDLPVFLLMAVQQILIKVEYVISIHRICDGCKRFAFQQLATRGIEIILDKLSVGGVTQTKTKIEHSDTESTFQKQNNWLSHCFSEKMHIY